MVTWGDIEIRIPTVLGDRSEMLAELVTEIRDQTGISPWVSPQPDGRPPDDRIQRVFADAPDTEWLLYVEDDVYLAPTFGEYVPDALSQTDRVAVQFFDLRGGSVGLETARKPLYSMCCLAVRSDIVEGFVDFYSDWVETVDHDTATDIGFGHYCTEIGEPIDVYRPSQVQHREIQSTFKGRSSKRQSPSFEG